MKWDNIQEMPCSVARALSVVGDRWTLLILRDCFMGTKRFDKFQKQIGLSRHRLTDRLNKLVEHEILKKVPYQEKPVRHEYRLTERGKALYPMLVSLIDWANAHVPIEGSPSVTLVSRSAGTPIAPMLVDRVTGEEITHRSVSAISNAGAKKA